MKRINSRLDSAIPYPEQYIIKVGQQQSMYLKLS